MRLFSEFNRTKSMRAKHDSPQYEFLDQSAWRSACYARSKIDEWGSSFPLDNDFIKRFTSRNNKQHQAAFFERAIHELYRASNLTVEFQAEMAKTSRRPDFTLGTNENNCAYSECTLSAMPDNIEGIQTLQNQINDFIEDIPSPDYFINIDYETSSLRSFSKKKLLPLIKSMLETGQERPGSYREIRKWTFSEQGWEIEFSLIPKSKPTGRTLGMVMPGGFGFVNSERPLRTALDRKRGKNYGRLECPYVICINSADPFLDDISIIKTLFGVRSDQQFTLKALSNAQGFFNDRGKNQNKSVSAVLIVRNLVPWNMHDVEMSLWHNPWSTYPFGGDILVVDQNFFIEEGDMINRHLVKGKSFGELLSIDRSYISKEAQN